jgi:hypothetical protein
MEQGPLGDYTIAFANGKPPEIHNGSFEIVEAGVLHFISTVDEQFWYSPSYWLSISKRT